MLKGSNQQMKRFAMVLFYIGGFVWFVFAVVKYLFGWDVTILQFLPYHLVAVISGILLKYGACLYERLSGRRKHD
ncbi:MAG: hypothetical protein WCK54_13080 [Desulfuromonadales bacterium]